MTPRDDTTTTDDPDLPPAQEDETDEEAARVRAQLVVLEDILHNGVYWPGGDFTG